MADVEVRILRGGQEITKVLRPLRELNGKPAVTYKKQLWPLINGNEVHLGGATPTANDDDVAAEVSDSTKGAPEFLVVPPALIEWDESQREVIGASAEDRLLIAAGPGTGKTAVACARVSQLVDQGGLEPSRIWLISFTRTAVREIRNRIAAYLEDAAAAYSVKIATLDAHAWTIHSGFDDKAQILGSHDENIERVLELVQRDKDVADYLEGVEHLVVDEAQDIVGVRAELVIELIRKLPVSSGVTVFADEAQAIYRFADDREVSEGGNAEPLLPSRLRAGEAGAFKERQLINVHRTGSPQLLTIFSDTRRKVLTASNGRSDHLREVRDDVIRLSHGEAPALDDSAIAELADAFILYRRRADVLLATSMLTHNGIAHRVRMSGLPVCLAPWIAAVLSDHTASNLNEDTFRELWVAKVEGTLLASCQPGAAWEGLVRVGGRTATVVDMRLLRQRLGRKQPPAELCHTELGDHGPIVGTIHASKGREADTVHLMLPYTSGQNIDQDEEARVVFVGATRGRARLLIGKGFRHYASRVDTTGRAYCLHTNDRKPRAQIEIGHEGDMSAEGLAGRRFFETASQVLASQARIRSLIESPVSLIAESDRSAGFAYRVKEDGNGPCLAVLSQSVNADLFSIAKAIQTAIGGGKRRPPDTLRHLHVLGVRSVVLPPDAPESEALHDPWKTSGILLAPLLLGYTTAFFPTMNMGRR